MRKILVALLGLLLCASLASADTLFPNTPTTGQIYNFNNTGVLYQWDGAKWITTGTTSPAITKQVFTSSGTYTPSSGMQYAIIECVGSGGGGGGVANSSGNGVGGGGGGGSYSRAYVTAAQVGSSQTVTVGAAGTGGTAGANNGTDGADVSVGTLCVGKGGSHGLGSGANGAQANGGGAGGVAGTGDVTVPGQAGACCGIYGTATTVAGGNASGGSSGAGWGAGATPELSAGTGGTGGLYGGGGGGGSSTVGSGAAAGGNGAKGIVVITEFLSSQWGGPLPQIVNPQGRLTLTTATPVTTSDVTGATTVYYTPYKGSYAPLWNGTQFTPVYFNEISAAMGANWAANSNYDWFLYNDAGTLRICTGPAWTSDTARGTGAGTTQISQVQGIYVNTVSMTCRYANASTVTVAASYGLYLGTMRTTASTGTTEDSAAKRFIWNMYNRVARPMKVIEGTASWSYSTSTLRQTNGSAANQLAFVRGLDEESVYVTAVGQAASSTATYREVLNAIGLDSTSTAASGAFDDEYCNSTQAVTLKTHYAALPGLGYHYLAWLEYGGGTDTQTWHGTFGAIIKSGIFGNVTQ